MREKICFIGGGWFSCHAAKEVAKMGYKVVMYEKNSGIFKGISGKNGRRGNTGIHYQTSQLTREGCKTGTSMLKIEYPELIINKDSCYGYANLDYVGNPSKVTKEHFLEVCSEYNNDEYQCEEIDPNKWGYENLLAAVKVKEPSLVSGKQLAAKFKNYLKDAGVEIKYNFEVTKIKKQANNKILVGNDNETDEFDHVINATAFMSLLPSLSQLPMGMEIVYQVCLALIYKNKEPGKIIFDKFTVMDGFYPCWLPVNEDNKYILTHGKLTNSSYSTPSEAEEKLYSYKKNDDYIKYVKSECEKEIKKYYPEFENLFEYIDWDGVVMPKIKTKSEFRGALAYRDQENKVIHVFPGKVGDIFRIASEVISLITNNNVLSDGNYEYIKDGILDKGRNEIQQKPQGEEIKRSTTGLQTSQEWENRKLPLVSDQSKTNGNPSCIPTFFKKHHLPSKRKNLTDIYPNTRKFKRKLFSF